MKDGVSLTSFLTCLLFEQRKVIGFYELILYLVSLLKIFISCGRFSLDFSGAFVYTIISSANNDSLTSSFLICIILISFNCLIPLAKDFNYYME